jgi:diaminopimelate epimerase
LNGYAEKDKDITVHLRGGDLTVRWAADNRIYMTGTATLVFSGEVEL